MVSGRCRVVDVDGEPVRVQWRGAMTDEGRAALAELVRFVRNMTDEDRAELDERSRERREREQQDPPPPDAEQTTPPPPDV